MKRSRQLLALICPFSVKFLTALAFTVKFKAFFVLIFQLLEKELNYDAIQVQFGEEIAKVVEFLTGKRDLG